MPFTFSTCIIANLLQVIFSMAGQLVQFGLVMLVVMLGFALSFFALFSDVDSYGVTMLTLFKVMLGDTAFFDEFEDEDRNRYETVAAVLLGVYLVIFTIMLLNLLIAVLSTSHAQVQENAEREFKVSKARLIERYRVVVDKDVLPVPFNILQLLVSTPFMVVDRYRKGDAYGQSKRIVGQLVFWLVLSPVAVAGGVLLWMVSTPYSPWVMFRTLTKNQEGGLAFANLMRAFLLVPMLLAWCLVGAPLYLVALWPLGLITMRFGPIDKSYWLSDGEVPPSVALSVDDILREAPGKLRVVSEDLRRFLDDPMSDPEVRQDELNRATTVEHVKLLRDRLEDEIKGHVDEKVDKVMATVYELEENVNQKLEALTVMLKDLHRRDLSRRQTSESKDST